MNAIKMSIVAIIAAICFVSVAATSIKEEVCQWQTFKAECGKDEIILMKEARYGRMNTGKCLTRNYMVGCSADVTAYMHGRCSGRQHCRVPVPDPVMFAATPCAKDLVAYLEAEYECVKVAKWEKESCDQVMTAQSGLIAKPADLVEDIRKKHHCPRRIVAQPGQTINVYLSDFFNKYHHQGDATTTDSPVRNCITYGHVAEDGTAAPSGICGGEFKENQLVYRSKSNVIDITLTAPSSHSHHYLIKYEVVGCPALKAPQHSWVEYKQDTAIVHCNNSHIATKLTCSDNEWVGEMVECAASDSPVQMSVSDMPLSSLFTNTGILVGVSIGVAMGVLVAIALAAFAIRMVASKKSGLAQQQLPASQQNSKTNLLKTSFGGSQDSGNFQGIESVQYISVVDPKQIPVHITDDAMNTYMTSLPVNHIVGSLYEASRTADCSVNLFTA